VAVAHRAVAGPICGLSGSVDSPSACSTVPCEAWGLPLAKGSSWLGWLGSKALESRFSGRILSVSDKVVRRWGAAVFNPYSDDPTGFVVT
jgi:hypothetical protein